MMCRACGGKTKVVDTHKPDPDTGQVWRRRKCKVCGWLGSTLESWETPFENTRRRSLRMRLSKLKGDLQRHGDGLRRDHAELQERSKVQDRLRKRVWEIEQALKEEDKD